MNASRFELEQAILELQHTTKHLQLLHEAYINGEEEMKDYVVSNHLLSIEYDLELRIGHVWDVFKQVFQLDQYASAEAKQFREEFLNTDESYWKKVNIDAAIKEDKAAKKEAKRRKKFQEELEEYFGVPIEDEV